MSEPFDSAVCAKATLDDLNFDQIKWFVSSARRARGTSIPNDATPQDLLERLHLIRDGRLTNAALILFGRKPHLTSPPVKCLQFQGTTAQTPLIQQHDCDGTIFEWLFQAAFFALKALSRPPERWDLPPYEIPKEAVQEAVLNALMHQDYSSKTGMQLALFSDRLEISNPGALPPSLTIDQLRQPHPSVPANPLLAQALYLNKNAELSGAGTITMIELCRKAGLPEPQFKLADNGFLTSLSRRPQPASAPDGGQAGGQAAPSVPPNVLELVRLLGQAGPLGNAELRQRLGLKGRSDLRERFVYPALDAGLIEPTIPDKPNSRLQKYRLTPKGTALLAAL
ncbi:MAG: transcriptional regulator [Elusimicrobia bacterium]|nr:transcriptional regulator [Elusimicrobiota bacterium]